MPLLRVPARAISSPWCRSARCSARLRSAPRLSNFAALDVYESHHQAHQTARGAAASGQSTLTFRQQPHKTARPANEPLTGTARAGRKPARLNFNAAPLIMQRAALDRQSWRVTELQSHQVALQVLILSNVARTVQPAQQIRSVRVCTFLFFPFNVISKKPDDPKLI